MTTYQPRQHRSTLPPIVVIDTRDLPPLDAKAAKPGDEHIVVVFSKPSVAHAFRHFRGSVAMLAQALRQSVKSYFACVNRGHIHRQRHI